MFRFCTALSFALIAIASATAADDTLDYLLSRATTAPSTRPASTRPSPLVKPQSGEALAATITLSDNSVLSGAISTTPGKPLRIWVEAERQYLDLPLSEIVMIDAAVLWERIEKEWHFIASGSDLKEYTGRTYPARELQFVFTLRDGRKITGGTVAPVYVHENGKQHMVVLPKRQKGEIGTTLPSLLYPKSVRIIERNTP